MCVKYPIFCLFVNVAILCGSIASVENDDPNDRLNMVINFHT